MKGTAGKAEAVHRNGRNSSIFHLELNTGVNGSALIFGNGKNRSVDQLLEGSLGDPHTSAASNLRQLRIVLCRLSGNGEGGVAGTDGDLIIFIHYHSYRTLRQTADNIAKQLSRNHTFAGFCYLCLDFINNCSFHIIAGQAQTTACSAQNTLNGRKTALLGNSSAGDIQTGYKHIFFTGKAHRKNLFSEI